MKLVFETEAKKSSTKIAQLLEQRTIELEMESKQLQEHEDNLEKTIADLKAINVKPKTKTKKPNEK
jgi:proteasome assembly chaperone (PAC2) family protein